MAETMVEKVARAICDKEEPDGLGNWENYKEHASAAIEAMPAWNDPKLAKAAAEVEEWWLQRGSFHFDHTPPSIRALQSALSMIDAALKEE